MMIYYAIFGIIYILIGIIITVVDYKLFEHEYDTYRDYVIYTTEHGYFWPIVFSWWVGVLLIVIIYVIWLLSIINWYFRKCLGVDEPRPLWKDYGG